MDSSEAKQAAVLAKALAEIKEVVDSGAPVRRALACYIKAGNDLSELQGELEDRDYSVAIETSDNYAVYDVSW